MRVISFDFETDLIRPGRLAPPASCVTWATSIDPTPKIEHAAGAEPRLTAWLEDDTALLVGQNVAYDMGVIGANYPRLLPLVFAAYRKNRVTDTKIRQQLLDIAGGCYKGRLDADAKWHKRDFSLEGLARRHLGRQLKKDGFRLFYGFFQRTPLGRWEARAKELQELAKDPAWALANLTDEQRSPKNLPGMLAADPAEAVRYPLEDAEATLGVFQVQEQWKEYLEDQYRQSRAAWWTHLMSAWGVHTNAAAVHDLQIKTEGEYLRLKEELVQAGLVREDGSRDTKAAQAHMVAVCKEKGLPLRLTPKDGVCMDADACEATEDPLLEAYAEFTTSGAVMSKDVPMLLKGTSIPIQPRIDLAESGRTTCSNPNVQNLRRLPGIRECFRPRPGKVFAQSDYEQLELHTLAQACVTLLGKSTLAELLNAGEDPHTKVAARIMGISLEEAKVRRKDKADHIFDNARQTAKVANFGFPGGLGPTRLCYFAKKTYQVVLSETEAKALKNIWLAELPEMRDFFGYVERLPENSLGRTLEQPFVKRFRGGASYTAACNSIFQGLGADCAKEAGWRISEACYVDTSSPLFGSRIVMFVHDEFILEVDDDDRASDKAAELARLMIEGAALYLPDVRPKTEPCLMRYYSKDAKSIVRDGRLVVWPEAA